MPYQTQERQKGRTLPQICLDVHMTHTGAYDRYPNEQTEDIEILRQAVVYWRGGVQGCEAFDEAVLQLIYATLDEVDGVSNQKPAKRMLVKEKNLPRPETLSSIADEVVRARKKFPKNSNARLLSALTEEAGELNKAFLEGESLERIRAEAKQVACVAIRIMEEATPQLEEHVMIEVKDGKLSDEAVRQFKNIIANAFRIPEKILNIDVTLDGSKIKNLCQ